VATAATRRLLSFAKRRINYYDDGGGGGGGGGDDGTITAMATTACARYAAAVAATAADSAAAARQLIGTSHFGAQKRAVYDVPRPVRRISSWSSQQQYRGYGTAVGLVCTGMTILLVVPQ